MEIHVAFQLRLCKHIPVVLRLGSAIGYKCGSTCTNDKMFVSCMQLGGLVTVKMSLAPTSVRTYNVKKCTFLGCSRPSELLCTKLYS